MGYPVIGIELREYVRTLAFQVLISGILAFVRKQYNVFSIHFKTSLPVMFTSIDVDKYKQAGSGWKRFVGRDGGIKQKKCGRKRGGQSLC